MERIEKNLLNVGNYNNVNNILRFKEFDNIDSFANIINQIFPNFNFTFIPYASNLIFEVYRIT
jgi:hypothetical protein